MKKTKIALFVLALFSVSLLFAQTREFKGKVFVQNTEIPIPGAEIKVSGDTKYKTKTDAAGEFVIPEAKGKFHVRAERRNFVSFSQEIPANANALVMYMSTNPSLNGDVELAFGKTSKRAATSSTGEVKLNENDISERSILSRLRTVPGVDVGVNGDITIRGVNSFNASGPPLIVVDGSILNGSLDSIDANDVARISVLKGSETAMYGSRGANGVILITTKSKVNKVK